MSEIPPKRCVPGRRTPVKVQGRHWPVANAATFASILTGSTVGLAWFGAAGVMPRSLRLAMIGCFWLGAFTLALFAFRA